MLTLTSKSNVLHLKKYVTKNNIKLGKPTGKTGYIKKKDYLDAIYELFIKHQQQRKYQRTILQIKYQKNY